MLEFFREVKRERIVYKIKKVNSENICRMKKYQTAFKNKNLGQIQELVKGHIVTLVSPYYIKKGKDLGGLEKEIYIHNLIARETEKWYDSCADLLKKLQKENEQNKQIKIAKLALQDLGY